jgi:hypothetical protein
MGDNAPAHKGKITKEIKTNLLIRTLEWPVSSIYLNGIEIYGNFSRIVCKPENHSRYKLRRSKQLWWRNGMQLLLKIFINM